MNDTTIHLPADEAPSVTGEFAVCGICNCQWQVKADSDKMGCAFCGAGEDDITVHREDLD